MKPQEQTAGGVGIPLSRAAHILADCTGNTVPGVDEPRVQRAARYLQADLFQLVDAVEDEVVRRELDQLRRLGGRRIA